MEFARDRGFTFLMSNDSIVRLRVSDAIFEKGSKPSQPMRQSDILVVQEQEMEFD